jgi:hypothetical protein
VELDSIKVIDIKPPSDLAWGGEEGGGKKEKRKIKKGGGRNVFVLHILCVED